MEGKLEISRRGYAFTKEKKVEKERVREEKSAFLIYDILYQPTTDQAEILLKKMGKVDVEAHNACTT